MNRLHGWYCSSDRWAKRLQGAVVPWVLGERSLGADALEVGPGPGLFAEVRRVLAPGALFLGSDSKSSTMFSVFHLFDTCVTVDPATLPARLEHAGFVEAVVREADSAFKFRARRP